MLTVFKEKGSTIIFAVLVLSFIFFISVSQTISVINRRRACFFLHTWNYWCMCWCVYMQLHASNGKDSIDDIAKILQNLDPNKAHGHDKISICMLQLCSNSICKPLELVFKQAMESGSFPSEWKKGTVVPIHKKDDKQSKIKRLLPWISATNLWKNFFISV